MGEHGRGRTMYLGHSQKNGGQIRAASGHPPMVDFGKGLRCKRELKGTKGSEKEAKGRQMISDMYFILIADPLQPVGVQKFSSSPRGNGRLKKRSATRSLGLILADAGRCWLILADAGRAVVVCMFLFVLEVCGRGDGRNLRDECLQKATKNDIKIHENCIKIKNPSNICQNRPK